MPGEPSAVAHRSEQEPLPLEQRLALSLSARARRAGSAECFLAADAVRGLLGALTARLDVCLLVEIKPPSGVRLLALEEVEAVLRRFDIERRPA